MLCNRQTAGFSYRMLMLLFYANVKHLACVRGGGGFCAFSPCCWWMFCDIHGSRLTTCRANFVLSRLALSLLVAASGIQCVTLASQS